MFLSLLFAARGRRRAHRASRRRWPAWQRRTAAGVVAFVLLILALLVAGVPLRMLGWHHWDDLVVGHVAGDQLHAGHHGALPRDRRVGAHAILVGRHGAAGARRAARLLAAARRRRPATRSRRRSPSARSTRSRSSSTVPTRRYFDGAVFCILLAGFLWLERVALRPARRGRRLRGGRRDRRARSSRRAWTATGRGSTTRTSPRSSSPRKAEAFSWTHSYGPLNWPRDGRELLRIKATAPAYWKATNLDEFDGVRWRDGSAVARRRHPAALQPPVAADDQGRRPRAALDAVRRRRRRAGHPPGRLAPGPAAERRHLRDLEQAAAPGRQLPGARLRRRTRPTRSSSARARTTPATPRTSSSCTCRCAARRSASWTRRRASRSAPPPTSASRPTAPTAGPASCGPAASASSRPATR